MNLDVYKDLKFTEDTHTYSVRGIPIQSTSRVIKELSNPFPFKDASENVAKKRNTDIKHVINEWEFISDSAKLKGHITHNHGEVGSEYKGYYITSIESYLSSVHNNNNLEIVNKELRIYSEYYWIAGTFDLLLKNKKTGKYILVDYKTNKNLFKTYNDELLPPFDDMINNPYNNYILQLNTYEILLEDADIEIESRIVVWLTNRSKHSLYTLYNIPSVKDRLKNYYEHRRNNIKHIIKNN